MQRGDTEFVWPENLLRSDKILVYLDQKQWVELALAAVDHPRGVQHIPALDALRELKAQGVVFPLSSIHFMESAPIVKPKWRNDLASVMEELSGFEVLASRADVQLLELEAALDTHGRARERPYAAVQLVARGSFRAFGRRGGLLILDREHGDDVADVVRAEWRGGREAFDKWREEQERALDRALLTGPQTDDEERELRARGWDPTAARGMYDDNAAFQQEVAARIASTPILRERVRDYLSAIHMSYELRDEFMEGLAARGLEIEDVWGDPDSSRRFIDSMPSADVNVSLKAVAHRNPQTAWTRNRIFDIDALSVAVPYCDFVATDREAAHALHAGRVPERMDTKVVATLDALVHALSAT
jgi:hypothetical protein